MNNSTIIKQLEKALAKKDDKELRLRVEVLVDMLKAMPEPVRPPVVLPSQSPTQPLPTYYETSDPNPLKPPYKVTSGTPKINGAGAITSANSEQINYTRPKGT